MVEEPRSALLPKSSLKSLKNSGDFKQVQFRVDGAESSESQDPSEVLEDEEKENATH
jgi:hypothetical protein